MKKDLEALKEKIWIIELLTIEAMIKKKSYYEEIYDQCDMSKVLDEENGP